ncbi:hypothetical protein FRC08_001074 [Ceratobasidium sp. 394]|nr:hypothetical protein FRC08_001074 [Ceratobasidium sp. 394]
MKYHKLGLVGIYWVVCAHAASQPTIQLEIPKTPPPTASRILNPAFASLSVDPAFWVEFFGNSTHPNKLSFQLIKQIGPVSLLGSDLLEPDQASVLGGVTQDSSIFDPSAGEPKRTISGTGGIYRTTYGPEFYKSFSNFAPSTKFTVTLNLGNDSLDIARDQARAAYKYLNHDKIWAFELGNEPGNYKATQRNLSSWGADTYVKQWQNWTGEIDADIPLKQPRWWGGSDGTTDDPNTVAIQTDLITARGVTGKTVKEFSQHMYQYSSCRPASNARAIVPNIMNHTNITSFVDILRSKIAAANSVGSDFVWACVRAFSTSGM